MIAEQHDCEYHYISNTTQHDEGKFVFRLPLKMDPTRLGSSHLLAEQRLHATERRLNRAPEL